MEPSTITAGGSCPHSSVETAGWLRVGQLITMKAFLEKHLGAWNFSKEDWVLYCLLTVGYTAFISVTFIISVDLPRLLGFRLVPYDRR